jgi:tetratricopeptide (TPR) repeat protein
VAALAVIAVSLEATLAVQDSQSAASRGALASALGYARTAEQVEPYGASPLLQEALVLERVGALRGAQRAALQAQGKEPANWRLPVILARIDAELGDTRAAVAASRRALTLNPGVALAAP